MFVCLCLHPMDTFNTVVQSCHTDQRSIPYIGYDVDEQYRLFAPAGAILLPAAETEAWKEKINKLYLLLSKGISDGCAKNLEATRRISFFMDIPSAPKVRNMLSFSFPTPYYTEVLLFGYLLISFFRMLF